MKIKSLATAILLGLGISAGANAHESHAAFTPKANVVKPVLQQVDGYYRFMLGDFEVTAIYDGYLDIGNDIYAKFTNLSKEELNKLIENEFRPLTETGGVNTAVSAYLINTGKNLILVDAGSGDVFGDKVGFVEANLKKAGYKPEQVDIILPTHLHFDHFSGVTRNGKAVFPNATIYISNQEKAFWYDTPIEKIPAHVQQYVQWTKDAVAPYEKAGKVFYYDSGVEVIPGVKSVKSFGHTPGHAGFEFESKGEKLFVWGDLLHNHAFQLAVPEVAAEFDVNAEGAREARLRLLPELAKNKTWIAGAHLPFPGIGHIRAEEKGGYSWVPVEYTPIEVKK
ncbi:MBL fold metallo-hydrolase [Actinobacillus equuli subsp. equuli]|uniref:MBL fold metallo-hydrolase n=1 Tax=Actinobacillus TaxID=713 RepID=UPI0009DAC4C4|nr:MULTISPECIES: MBL fold metallo-hydrolase [Actinobacillus]OQS56881.1 MBL fold metallo-hydrolase [Actinobacillus suis]WGE66230.1 MBL fold metallo-hydrolase [Actinobacillus equuli subsp. equuli]WGE70570.1 MBL fold metallo-hydrolase [Actinobacillus equuli subsp. haemolyticus]